MYLLNKIHLVPYNYLTSVDPKKLMPGIYYCLKTLPLKEQDELMLITDIIDTFNSSALRTAKPYVINYGRKLPMFKALSKEEAEDIRLSFGDRINCLVDEGDNGIRLSGNAVYDPACRIHTKELSTTQLSLIIDIMFFYLYINGYHKQKQDALFKEFFETQQYYGYVLSFRDVKYKGTIAELLNLRNMANNGLEVPIGKHVQSERLAYMLSFVSHYTFTECKYTNLANLKFRQGKATLTKPSKRFGIKDNIVNFVKQLLIR